MIYYFMLQQPANDRRRTSADCRPSYVLLGACVLLWLMLAFPVMI